MNYVKKIQFDTTENKFDVNKSFPGLVNVTALSYLYLYYDLCEVKENLDNKIKNLSKTYPDFYANKEIENMLLDLKFITSKLQTQLIKLEIIYRREKFEYFLRKIKMWKFALSNYKFSMNRLFNIIDKFEKNKLLIAEKYGKVK